MSASDLKLKLFRQIDTLEKHRLEELYGIVMNFLNGKKDTGEWEKLAEIQKQGILDAIAEIDEGKGIPHEEVMERVKKKYLHA
jgi:hypothetical protein